MTDTKQDYISTMDTQFLVNIFAQATNNVLIYFCIVNSNFMDSPYIDKRRELQILDVQFGMQVLQLFSVVILMFTPLRSSRNIMCWFKIGPIVHWCLA